MLTTRLVPARGAPSVAGGVNFNVPLLVHGQNLVILGFASAQHDSSGAPIGGAARFGIDYPNDRWDNFIGVNVTGAAYAAPLGFVFESESPHRSGSPAPASCSTTRRHGGSDSMCEFTGFRIPEATCSSYGTAVGPTA